jgi:hypothetical protein
MAKGNSVAPILVMRTLSGVTKLSMKMIFFFPFIANSGISYCVHYLMSAPCRRTVRANSAHERADAWIVQANTRDAPIDP